MLPNNPKKYSLAFTEMSIKKRVVIIILALFVIFLWAVGLRSSGGLDDYLSMKQAIANYENLLRETRQQLLDRLSMCHKTCVDWDPQLPVLYIITPTYARPVQKAELTRLSHTLMHVHNIHWIVIEDSEQKTPLVENLLIRTTLNYTHLNAPTPDNYKRKGSEPNWRKPRGVEQRNKALRWLRKNKKPYLDLGVVYFADDDNTYSLEIFDQMRWTKEVSVWPVGLVGGLLVEKPLLNYKGHVDGFNSAWRPDRPFPLDMAGFAINLNVILKNPKAEFMFNVSGGFQESVLLEQLTTRDKLEPLADNCTKVLVWHTRTEAPKLNEEIQLQKSGATGSDFGMEV